MFKIFFLFITFFSIFQFKSFSDKDPVKSAKDAIQKNDLTTALEKLKEAYEEKEYRNSFETNFLFGEVFSKMGNSDSAIFYYSVAITFNEKNPIPYIVVGDEYVKQSLIPMAIQQYEKSIELDSSNSEIFLKLGKLYAKQRDYTTSVKNYMKVIEKDTANIEAFKNLGDIYIRAKQFSNAAKIFNRLSLLQPNDLEIKLQLMKSLINAKSSNEALPIAEQIVSMDSLIMDSSIVEVHRFLAKKYYETKNYEKAETEFLFLQEKYTLSNDEILSFAKIKKQLQRSDAVSFLEKYISTTKEDSSMINEYKTLAEQFMNESDYEKAIYYYELRIKYDPNAISAYMNIAICNIQLKDFYGAENYLKQVIEKNPVYVKAHKYLAQTYGQMENLEEQSNAYKKMIEVIADTTANYKTELAEAYGFEGYYKFVTGSKTKDDQTKKQYYSQAITNLKKALEFDENNVSYNLMLAQLLHSIGEFDKAKLQYKKVLQLDSSNKDAKKGLEQLNGNGK